GHIKNASGAVEIQGTVEQLESELLTSKYTETPAVAYDYRLKVHEDSRPGDTGPEWKTVDSGTVTQPFYVTDETGSVAVDPDGATVSLDAEKISGGSTVDIGPVDASTDKKFEGRLAPGDQVHVYGEKRAARGDGPGDEQFYVGGDEETDTFTVSDTTEFRTALRYLGNGVLWLLFGLAALALSALTALVVLGRIEVAGVGSALVALLACPRL
ncbi:MAG: hypothetical protein ACI8TL_001967, partial [Natronomonas sp.]